MSILNPLVFWSPFTFYFTQSVPPIPQALVCSWIFSLLVTFLCPSFFFHFLKQTSLIALDWAHFQRAYGTWLFGVVIPMKLSRCVLALSHQCFLMLGRKRDEGAGIGNLFTFCLIEFDADQNMLAWSPPLFPPLPRIDFANKILTLFAYASNSTWQLCSTNALGRYYQSY